MSHPAAGNQGELKVNEETKIKRFYLARVLKLFTFVSYEWKIMFHATVSQSQCFSFNPKTAYLNMPYYDKDTQDVCTNT